MIDSLSWSAGSPFGGYEAGVDEVGIGPLAGPVTACAVILDPARPIPGLNDSKVLSEQHRQTLDGLIRERALGWALGWASVAEIDAMNILAASHLAMRRAMAVLQPMPGWFWIDGNKVPGSPRPCVAVVKGDRRVPQISAASIVAKVARDDLMRKLHVEYPQYGWDKHKGYPTKAHIAAIHEHGVCKWHRHSFAPVRKVLEAKALQTGAIAAHS